MLCHMLVADVRWKPDEHAGLGTQSVEKALKFEFTAFVVVIEVDQQTDIPVDGFGPCLLLRQEIVRVCMMPVVPAGHVAQHLRLLEPLYLLSRLWNDMLLESAPDEAIELPLLSLAEIDPLCRPMWIQYPLAILIQGRKLMPGH